MSPRNLRASRPLTLTLNVTVKSESKPEEIARVLTRLMQVAWETPHIVRGIADEVGVLGVGEFQRPVEAKAPQEFLDAKPDTACQFEGCAACGARCHTCGKTRGQHEGEKA